MGIDSASDDCMRFVLEFPTRIESRPSDGQSSARSYQGLSPESGSDGRATPNCPAFPSEISGCRSTGITQARTGGRRLAGAGVGVLLSARRRERRRRRRSGATGAGWLDAGKERSQGRVGSASRSVVWGRPTETTTGGGDLGPIIALGLVACEEPLRPRRVRVLGQGHGTHARAPPPPAGRLARNWAARPTAGVTRGE